jgi:hypothetical protein
MDHYLFFFEFKKEGLRVFTEHPTSPQSLCGFHSLQAFWRNSLPVLDYELSAMSGELK